MNILPPPIASTDSVVVRLYKAIFALLCIVLASLPSVYFAHIGLGLFDEPYQMLNSFDYKNTPLAPLSNYFGYLFGSIFGWEWIKFRYLTFALHKLAILIGCFYMWRKTKAYWQCMLITIPLLIVSSIFYTSQNWYGWDSWTLPFVVLTIVLFIEYLEHNSLTKVILLGCLTAVTGLCRVPNFAMAVFIAAAMLFARKNEMSPKSQIKPTVIYLLVTAIATIAIILAIYGSLTAYLECLSENRISDHSAFTLIIAPVTSILAFMYYPALLWCSYLAIAKSSGKGKLIFGLVSFAVLCVLYYFCLNKHSNLFANVQLYFIALTIIVGVATYLFNKRLTGVLLSLLLLGCVPIVGSNTGLLKYVAIPMLPILFIFMREYVSRKMVVFSCISVIAVLLYAYNGVRDKSGYDVGTVGATYEMPSGLAKGLKTEPSRGTKIMHTMADIEPYAKRGYHIIVMRKEAQYIYEYLLLSRNSYLRHRFGAINYDDAEYVAQVEREIADSGNKVAILRFGDYNKPSLMNESLAELCTQVLQTPEYCIYLKK